MRKNKDFEMMDRIDIFVDADEDVKKAINTFAEYIKKETDSIEEKINRDNLLIIEQNLFIFWVLPGKIRSKELIVDV